VVFRSFRTAPNSSFQNHFNSGLTLSKPNGFQRFGLFEQSSRANRIRSVGFIGSFGIRQFVDAKSINDKFFEARKKKLEQELSKEKSDPFYRPDWSPAYNILLKKKGIECRKIGPDCIVERPHAISALDVLLENNRKLTLIRFMSKNYEKQQYNVEWDLLVSGETLEDRIQFAKAKVESSDPSIECFSFQSRDPVLRKVRLDKLMGRE